MHPPFPSVFPAVCVGLCKAQGGRRQQGARHTCCLSLAQRWIGQKVDKARYRKLEGVINAKDEKVNTKARSCGDENALGSFTGWTWYANSLKSKNMKKAVFYSQPVRAGMHWRHPELC